MCVCVRARVTYEQAALGMTAPKTPPIPLFLTGISFFIYTFLIYAHFLKNIRP
jgi:hypothetical protein